ncbi:hypothetical protein BC826DRAFT_52786 [Russula brevipes]|nr:hypothetical protein BC826DRAFT_52786 [Russula brevipes]
MTSTGRQGKSLGTRGWQCQGGARRSLATAVIETELSFTNMGHSGLAVTRLRPYHSLLQRAKQGCGYERLSCLASLAYCYLRCRSGIRRHISLQANGDALNSRGSHGALTSVAMKVWCGNRRMISGRSTVQHFHRSTSTGMGVDGEGGGWLGQRKSNLL